MVRLLPILLALFLFLLRVAVADSLPIKRCVNLSNALEAPREGEWGYRIEDEHIAAIAADGFDTIRLPVRFQAGYADGIDPILLARVDHVIRTALSHDLRVVLDFHHFFELMDAPDQHADQFQAIWTEISTHYAGWPDALMFELLNEPEGALTTEKADALYDRVYPILRTQHPDRWIIVGGGDWSSLHQLKALTRRDGRTAFTFHYYSPFDFTHQTASWVDAPPPRRGPPTEGELARIKDEIAALAGYPVPLFLGEFGAYHVIDAAERAVWTQVVRRASEAAGIGWCHWGYASGFRLTNDELTWLPGLREALFSE